MALIGQGKNTLCGIMESDDWETSIYGFSYFRQWPKRHRPVGLGDLENKRDHHHAKIYHRLEVEAPAASRLFFRYPLLK